MSFFKKILKKEETAKKTPAKTSAVSVAPKQDAPVSPQKTNKKVVFSHVIVRPLITEKAAHHQSTGVYTFAVRKDVNKHEVARAVAALYGVKPVMVRMINAPGKTTNFRRTVGRRGSWKKALITLPKGSTIQVHENV